MSSINANQLVPMNQLLSQIRSLRQGFPDEAGLIGNQAGLGLGNVKDDKSNIGFSAMFEQAIGEVNNLQRTSSDLKRGYEIGDPNISFVDVTLASQKASVAFDAMVQVRKKVVEAYKEIMNMPV